MEIKAKLNHLHIAPRKVRLIADVIRGMPLAEAERELEYRIKRSSPLLLKLLRSATANAAHNFHIGKDSLVVKSIRVDPGPVATKYRPRAFGRAAAIRRRTSHVSLVLEANVDGVVQSHRPRPAEPTVRDATAEDFRGDLSGRTGVEKPEERNAAKPKSSDFIRRIFQRKVI